MSFSLSKYLERLEAAGELVRVKAAVDPVLEIAEITDRVSKSPGGGRALLFENTGTGFPVVTNLFGSERRIAMALGAESLDAIAERLEGVLHEAMTPKGTFAEKLHTLPLLAEMSHWFPRQIRGKGACQQVIKKGAEAKLSDLPVLKCWPHDGGRFITLPLVHTVHPETGARNVGMYRMQVFNDRSTGMHWHIHKTGARHYEAYHRAGMERMPVSVCLGGDPAYTYAATAPMPEGMDEYLLAGFLRRRPVELVKCVTNDLWVPSDCDFVIEGYIDTFAEKVVEGPFGDHTGFYSLEDLYPVFHVTAITHRRDAVYPATVVGIPPQEDAWFAAATEKIFLPPIRLALQPEIRDMYMPAPGVAHNLAIVSIDTAYAGQAEKVANGLWGAGQMMFNKVLIAVPAGVDIRDPQVMFGLLRGADALKCFIFGHGIADVLDHAMAVPGVGSKLLIDATAAKPPGLADGFVPPRNSEILFDEGTEGLAPYEYLWLGLANIDPARDIRVEERNGRGFSIIDCRAKVAKTEGMPRRWPNVVVMDLATEQLVDRRWSEYDIGEPLPSPSERYRRLLLSDGAEV